MRGLPRRVCTAIRGVDGVPILIEGEARQKGMMAVEPPFATWVVPVGFRSLKETPEMGLMASLPRKPAWPHRQGRAGQVKVRANRGKVS